MSTISLPLFTDIPPRTPLCCQVLTADCAHAVLATWRELEQRLQSKSVASSASWTECWIQNYGDIVPYRFLIAESGGIARGVCLLTSGVGQKNGPFRIRTRHVGTAGEPQPGSVCVEYNHVLVDPDFRLEFIAHIANALQADPGWEQLCLDGFSEQELAPWQPHFPEANVRSRESRYFDLRAAREAGQSVIDQLGKSTRSNLRRKLKQYGTLDCEWASSLDQADDILQELIRLHQTRWQAVGQPGAFASERFRTFQLDAVLKLFLEERVILFRVRHQSETVGCLLLLVDENRLLDYLSGFADFDVKPSPGLTTHYLCMEAALQRGFDAYDFLVGEKRHKENLSNQSRQLCWLTWSRPSWKFKTLEWLRWLKARCSRWFPRGGTRPAAG